MKIVTCLFKIDYPSKNDWGRKYGLNSIYAGKHWTKRQKDSDYWHMLVKACLINQGVKREIFTKPVEITFYWNDRLDISNHAYMAKMIEDALKGYLIADDSRKYVKKHTYEFHNEKFILVEIKEYERSA